MRTQLFLLATSRPRHLAPPVADAPPPPPYMSVLRAALPDLLEYGWIALVARIRRLLHPELCNNAPPPSPTPLPCAGAGEIDEHSLVSVIVPSFNEVDGIAAAVSAALADGGAHQHVEVIVVDGGSKDGTRAAAAAAGATVLAECCSSRAACLNAGAAAARGDVLIFLHGDTILPRGFSSHVRLALRDPAVAVAAFSLRLSPRLPLLWLVEWGANLRSRRRQLPYGDQSLCMRREVFESLGGFPVQPLLEDLDLVHTARASGIVRTLHPCVVSSSRRWQINGVLGNTLKNQLVLFGHALGVPVGTMARWYYGQSGKKKY